MNRPGASKRGPYAPSQTRELLLSSAVELFGRQGFHATSVQQIVDGAGLTKGAFYHHFTGKEVVLGLIVVDALAARREAVEAVVARGDSAPEQCQQIVRALVRESAGDPARAAVVLHERRHLTAASKEDVRRLEGAVEGMLDDAVRHGIEVGDFQASVDPRSVALALLALLDGVQHQLWTDRERAEQIADELARVIVRGLARRRLDTSDRPASTRGADALSVAPRADGV